MSNYQVEIKEPGLYEVGFDLTGKLTLTKVNLVAEEEKIDKDRLERYRNAGQPKPLQATSIAFDPGKSNVIPTPPVRKAIMYVSHALIEEMLGSVPESEIGPSPSSQGAYTITEVNEKSITLDSPKPSIADKCEEIRKRLRSEKK